LLYERWPPASARWSPKRDAASISVDRHLDRRALASTRSESPRNGSFRQQEAPRAPCNGDRDGQDPNDHGAYRFVSENASSAKCFVLSGPRRTGRTSANRRI